ncbi:protein-L-isoaspartate O-methyltransferase family protein [Roseomonas sp. BN140053]|uniref:protein-L-isoaspartate O-methyltransferase family protein n=1 Tax=Roseomonas sp. BN140053 TaxID=3391898 RepID=UPI0039EADE97
MDFAEARRHMVDGQLRPNRITDPRLVDAMLHLPRESYAPAAQASRAMADGDLPLGGGRVLMQPMMLARLLQLAAVRPGDRALVVGSGSGYGAAVLATVGAQVVALEEDERLLALAAAAPRTRGVRQERGPLAAGWPAGAPYEVIVIEGAIPAVPAALSEQLAEGGRLVTVLQDAVRPGAAVLGTRTGGAFATADVFDCRTALLPGFAPEPGFVFA